MLHYTIKSLLQQKNTRSSFFTHLNSSAYTTLVMCLNQNPPYPTPFLYFPFPAFYWFTAFPWKILFFLLIFPYFLNFLSSFSFSSSKSFQLFYFYNNFLLIFYFDIKWARNWLIVVHRHPRFESIIQRNRSFKPLPQLLQTTTIEKTPIGSSAPTPLRSWRWSIELHLSFQMYFCPSLYSHFLRITSDFQRLCVWTLSLNAYL